MKAQPAPNPSPHQSEGKTSFLYFSNRGPEARHPLSQAGRVANPDPLGQKRIASMTFIFLPKEAVSRNSMGRFPEFALVVGGVPS